MLVLEFKVRAKKHQYIAIDEAIRTAQFVQNKCLRFWMDNEKVNKYDLNKYCRVLAHNFDFANKLNSQARQSSAERTWSAISRFYDNCKKKIPGKKGFPKFKKNCRSVEYKTTGWKLDLTTRKAITFTDKNNIGRVKLIGTYDLNFYPIESIKRVRLIRRADGYYCQFILSVNVKIDTEPANSVIGLDVGLESFYTEQNGNKIDNPRFLKKGEKKLKRLQRKLSRKKKGSSNRRKARARLAKAHLKISRQRKDFAVKLARCVIYSNDVIAYEDLSIKNLVKNHCLAKSINDAAWYQFREWIEYLGEKHGKITVAVPPHYTSQKCSNCGETVKKSLSTRTHICACGCHLDRDENAARNILKLGLSTAGHSGTWLQDSLNDLGEDTATFSGGILFKQVTSVNKESPVESVSLTVGVSRGLSLMEMYNPMHPGEVIKELYIEASGMSLRAIAEALGVSAPTFSRLVSGKSSVSVEMAFRLERVLGGSAESWLQMQTNYDLWQTKQSDRYQEIKKLKKLEIA